MHILTISHRQKVLHLDQTDQKSFAPFFCAMFYNHLMSYDQSDSVQEDRNIPLFQDWFKNRLAFPEEDSSFGVLLDTSQT